MDRIDRIGSLPRKERDGSNLIRRYFCFGLVLKVEPVRFSLFICCHYIISFNPKAVSLFFDAGCFCFCFVFFLM